MPRILLVEDEEPLRRFVRLMLDRLGRETIEASNGKEALKLYDAHPVDLVITDILMPEMEGLETISRFCERAMPPKIIAMSGGGQLKLQNLLPTSKLMGADQTLAKPFTNNELVHAINSALENTEESAVIQLTEGRW